MKGTVKNSIEGLGCADIEGTTGNKAIPVNENEGQSLSYKKVKFPASAVTVKKTPKAKTLTYNGEAQTLLEAGETEGGTLYYAFGVDNENAPSSGYKSDIPSKTEVGTYYVWYKTVGDSDHYDSEPVCIEATIAPDKTDLKNAIAAATAYYDSIKNNNSYSAIASELKTAIDAAQAVAEDVNATARNISKAEKDISVAKAIAAQKVAEAEIDKALDKAISDAKASADTAKAEANAAAADEYASADDKTAISNAVNALDEKVAAANNLPANATAEQKRDAAAAINDAVKTLSDATDAANIRSATARAEVHRLQAAKNAALDRLQDYAEAKAIADATQAETTAFNNVLAAERDKINSATNVDAVINALSKAKAAINDVVDKIIKDRVKTPVDTTPVGSVHNVGGSMYVVTSASTASLVKAPSKKSFTLPATVGIAGKTFNVTGINVRAFAGTKVKTLTVKTKGLTKASVKYSLKGSKIKTVKVKVGKKKTNKKYVKKYKKYFTKKNCGKKVRVRR